jgi:hypothetical protein
MQFTVEQLQIMRLAHFRREYVRCACGGRVSATESRSMNGGHGTPVHFHCDTCGADGTADSPREPGSYTESESRTIVSEILAGRTVRCPRDGAYLDTNVSVALPRIRRAFGWCRCCGAQAFGDDQRVA